MNTTFDLSIIKLNFEVTLNNYKKLVKRIYDEDTTGLTKEEVLDSLLSAKKEWELLMEQAHSLQSTGSEQELRDLQYQIFDHLLYSGDLINFYKEDLFDRFRLRVENHQQKERVNRLL